MCRGGYAGLYTLMKTKCPRLRMLDGPHNSMGFEGFFFVIKEKTNIKLKKPKTFLFVTEVKVRVGCRHNIKPDSQTNVRVSA